MFFLSVKNKISPNNIAFSFGLIIIMMLIQAILSIWRFNEVKIEFEHVVDVYNVRMELAQKMRVIARERSPILFTMVNTKDAFDLDDLLIEFQHLGSLFLNARKKLVATNLSDREKELLEKHREYALSVIPAQRVVISLIEEGETKKARDLLVNAISPNQIKALSYLDKLIKIESENSKAAMKKAKILFDKSQRDMILTTSIGSFISIVIGFIVSIRFTYFIKRLKKNKGDLEKTVKVRTKELVASNEKLEYMANYDSLTKLPNRALFIVLLEQAMKQVKRNKLSVALFFIDLDGFKAINDTYGHDCGDELLRQVANRLKKVLREEDGIFRLGGDEFTLILTNIEIEDNIKIVAKKVIETLAMPFDILGQTCQIGSSIGIALYPQQASDLDELIKYSDTAMYDVKNTGKNNYKIYSST